MSSNTSIIKNYPNIEPVQAENFPGFKKQLNFIGQGKSILEFGCATGYFSRLLLQRNCSVVGIEVNPDAAKLAEEFCDEVLVVDLDFVSISELLHNRKFDVAVFGDVLEHLRDPWRVLEQVRQLLNPGGYVVASIPNIAHGAVRLHLLQGDFDYAEFGILDRTHLRFFTRKTLHKLFEESGYTIESIDRTITPIFSISNCIPSIDRSSLDGDLATKIEQSEDSDTLQFVVRAFPLSEDTKYNILLIKHQDLESAYQDIESTYKLSLSQQKSELSDRLKTLEEEIVQYNLKIQEIQSEKVGLSNQLEISQAEILDMRRTKFWKLRNRWLQLKHFFRINKLHK